MKFGLVPVDELEGLVLAHSVRAGDKQFRKGETVTTEMAATMAEAGLAAVFAIELEVDDLDESSAAAQVAASLANGRFQTSEPATGRVNLFAQEAGLLMVNAEALAELNQVDEGITVATLPGFSAVQKGQLVATVKIIPFAVKRERVEATITLGSRQEVIGLAPFRPRKACILLTRWPSTPDRLIDKSLQALANRLSRVGSTLLDESVVAHESDAVRSSLQDALRQGAELILCLGASATADRRDIIPGAITSLGGRILRFGIPVDPGNLVMTAELEGCPVLVLPGSARSERRSGADWVVERTVAGMGLDSASLAHLGAGGLLKEMSSRPRPRLAPAEDREPKKLEIAGLLLAAGSSRRLKGEDKLLRDFRGQPMVGRTVNQLARAGLDTLHAVVRPGSEAVSQILAAAGVSLTENPDADEGMGASIRAGIGGLPESIDAVMIALADMPLVAVETFQRLIKAFRAHPEALIAVPIHKGRQGNPVIFRRDLFASLAGLSGDKGARDLIEDMREVVLEVEVDDKGILRDFDTEKSFEETDLRAKDH